MADTTILKKCITFGPWGSSTAKEWTYIPEGFIKKIRISHDGSTIYGIEFHSDCSVSGTKKSFFGCSVGSRTDTIFLNCPDEYLIKISGKTGYDRFGGSYPVRSLCFHTNRNCYGPYGNTSAEGTFSSDGYKGGMIVGFHGHAEGYIWSIGIYVMPYSLAMDRYSTLKENFGPEKCCKMCKLGIPRDVGPWGDSGGKAWDDGVFNNIKQVRIQIGDPSKVIFGIQFKYVKNDGKHILSRLHGGADADLSEIEINLDGVEEYLTGISGFYGPIKDFNGLKGITSITFNTNKMKQYGPYGQVESEEAGLVYFTSYPSGKVVGFHGRNDEVLTAIGVHMEYF